VNTPWPAGGEGLRLWRETRTQMRRTVLRTEQDWKGYLPRVSAAVRPAPRSPWSGRAMSKPRESGRGIRLTVDSNGGLSGACLAQQGWSSPQGTFAGASVTKTGDASRECKVGQQEWSCPREECEVGFWAVKSLECGTDARATGTLQQQSKASTTAAMNFLCIAVQSRD